MDPLHNDELPCCRRLQGIAQDILPSPVVGNNHGSDGNYGVDFHKNDGNIHGEIKPSVSTDPQGSTYTLPPVPRGFLEMIQDFLWNQFYLEQQRQQQQQQQQQQTLDTTKRKRKKKKKKKTKGADVSAAAASEKGGEEEEDGTLLPYSGSGDSEVQIQRSGGVSHQVTAETSTTSSVIQSAQGAERGFSKRPRSWWVHCYLDRISSLSATTKITHGPEQRPPACEPLRIVEFLRVLEPKVSWLNENENEITGQVPDISGHGTEQGIQQQQQQQQQQRSKHGKQQRQPSGGDSSSFFPDNIHVSKQDLERLAMDIQCVKCRSRVNNYLSNQTRIPLLPLDEMVERNKGDGRRISQHLIQFDDVPVSFDYVAMEEGHAGEFANDENHATLVLKAVQTEKGETVGWRLQKRRPEEQNGENHSITTTLTPEDFAFLLHEFMLLPAVSYDTWIGACDADTLSAEKIGAITSTVEKQYSEILDEFRRLMKHLENQQEQLSKVQNGFFDEFAGDLIRLRDSDDFYQNKDGVDMKCPVVLNGVEGAICDVWGNLLRILLKVTHAYQEIMLQWDGGMASTTTAVEPNGNHGGEGGGTRLRYPSFLLGQVSSILSMWQPFLDGIARILRATENFEHELFQLADRLGNLKSFFCCQRSRELQASLVQTKLKTTVCAMDSIMKQLDEQHDLYETPAKTYKITFLRSILTQQVLLQNVRKNVTHGQQFSGHFSLLSKGGDLKSLNDACEDVLYEIRNEWTEGIRQINISNIRDLYEIKREKLGRLLHTAFTLLDHQLEQQGHDGCGEPDIGDDAGVYNFLLRISQDGNQHGDFEQMLHSIRTQLAPAVEVMIRRWLVLSTAATKTSSSNSNSDATAGDVPPSKPLIMPLRLIQWMSPEGHSSVRSHSLQCPGADGSLRATCLITTLLYAWLIRQYDEWQAELAEQELLQIMTDSDDIAISTNDGADPAGTGATSSAKKKAKKKKGKISDATASALQPNDLGKAESKNGKIFVDSVQTNTKLNGEQQTPSSSKGVNNRATLPPSQLASVNCIVRGKEAEARHEDLREVTHAATNIEQVEQRPIDLTDSRTPLGVDQNAESPLVARETISSPKPSPGEIGDDFSPSGDPDGDEFSGSEEEEGEAPRKESEDSTRLSRMVAGIIDGPIFIPAEEFLLNRLLNAVSNANDNDGYPIVYLQN